MRDKYLNGPIEELRLKSATNDKLKIHNVKLVRDLWSLKRKELKDFQLSDNEINQIIIKLQLNGMDLNKKVY